MRVTKDESMYDECIALLLKLSLVGGNNDFLDNINDEEVRQLEQALLSTNIETREAVLEILCNLTDRKFETKINVAD